MTDVFQAFVSAASSYPKHIALHIQGSGHTYQAFSERVFGIAEHLFTLRHERIGIWTTNHVDTYAALLATLGAGAAYVPVNEKFPAARNIQILQDSGLTLLLAPEPDSALELLLAAVGEELSKPLEVLYTGPLPSKGTPPPHTPPLADAIAYLLFTSGSTGRPKGVPISHGSLNHFLTSVMDRGHYELSAQDRFVQMFELTFDLSVYSMLVPLCMGAGCYVPETGGISYLKLVEMLEEQAITVALLVPSVLSYLTSYFDEINLPALRYNLFCGEALPDALAQGWLRCIPNAQLENVYGPTEATIFCLRYVYKKDSSPTEAWQGIVPIGKPMMGVGIVLVSEQLQPAAEGELCLGGAQITAGYWQNPERNRTAFFELGGRRYYRSGDICRRNAAGDLLYLGRTDAQVKIDGYRVELGEIEHHARQVSGAAQVAVIALKNQLGAVALHLFLAGAVDEKQVALALSQRLPTYMQPRSIYVMPALPLNSNGKIDRGALAKSISPS